MESWSRPTALRAFSVSSAVGAPRGEGGRRREQPPFVASKLGCSPKFTSARGEAAASGRYSEVYTLDLQWGAAAAVSTLLPVPRRSPLTLVPRMTLQSSTFFTTTFSVKSSAVQAQSPHGGSVSDEPLESKDSVDADRSSEANAGCGGVDGKIEALGKRAVSGGMHVCDPDVSLTCLESEGIVA